MKLIKGSELTSNQVKQVKSAFVHRFTGEHRPQWANKPTPSGNEYKPQFNNDHDWLMAYAFYFKNDGTLSHKPNHCVPVSLM